MLLLTACADSRGKKAYIDDLEKDRYQKSVSQSYQAGNLVQLIDQNGTLRSVALKDINGDGIADGIDLDGDGNLDIRLLAGNETRVSPWAFIAPIDIDNNGSADYFLSFTVAGNSVQIKFLSANNSNALPLTFLVNGSNQITGLDKTGDAVSDDARLNGTVIVSAGSAPDSTPPSPPGAPGGVSGGTTQIDLSWTAATDDTSAAGAISYEICQATSAGGCSAFTATYTVAAGQTNYSATGLSALTTYYFVVRARDASGNFGTPSSEFSATTAASGTVNNPTYAPVAGVFGVGQSVTISTTTPAASICYTTDGVTTPACDAAALCTTGATYFSPVAVASTATLQAIACKTGNTASSVVSGTFSIDTTGPSVPGSAVAWPTSATQLDLTWAASTDDFTAQANIVYEICQTTTSGACSAFAVSHTTGAGAINFSATGLTPLTTYYFVIRAKDQVSNNGTTSAEISNTTPAAGTVADPTYLPVAGTYATAQNVTLSSVTPGATICYTTDGVTNPACDAAATCTTGSTYGGAINTTVTTNYRAMGCKVGFTASGVIAGTIAIGVDTWDDTTRPRVLSSSSTVKPNINTSWGPLASAVKYKLYNWTGTWNYESETTNVTHTYLDDGLGRRVCGTNITDVEFHCSVFSPPPNHAAAVVNWQAGTFSDYFTDGSVGTAYYLHNAAQATESGGYIQLNQNVTDNGPRLDLYFDRQNRRYVRIHFKKYFHRASTYFSGQFALMDYENTGRVVYISMYHEAFGGLYGFAVRESYFDMQNLTPTGQYYQQLNATQEFDQWLDFEIVLDTVTKNLRMCKNGICYSRVLAYTFSNNIILQHDSYEWWTGAYVRLDDYEVESSDTDFPVYPTPGNSLVADVSYFGERYHATANINGWNASHAANFAEDTTGKQHFAFSDNGTVKYATSTDKGALWNYNNPTSARAEKASLVGLAIGNDGNPIIVGTHDTMDYDGNMGTDNPGNYTRESFEAVYNGSIWNYQGIKRSWNWTSDSYGYVQSLSNLPGSYVVQYPVLLPDGSFSYAIEEAGWYKYGHVLHEIRRTAGIWDTAYSVQNYASDGVIISGDTSGYPDATLQTPFASQAKADGTLYSFYNKLGDHAGVAPCQVYFRTRPNAGSWSAPTLLAGNGRGWAAKLDENGNFHLLYSGCNTSTGMSTENLYYSFNGGAGTLISTEAAGDLAYYGDLFVSKSGKVTAVWSIANSAFSQFKEIRYAECSPEGAWSAAANLTSAYTGYGKNSPFFIRGNRYDVFPRRRQLVYNENYNDGTDKKRIMLYTWPDS